MDFRIGLITLLLAAALPAAAEDFTFDASEFEKKPLNSAAISRPSRKR